MSGFTAQPAASKAGITRVEHIYEVGDVLGKGSFSVVRLGTHRLTKEKVALKVVPSQNYKHNDRAKQLIRTEVAVMDRVRRMAHPNLMQFKHTFEDPEKIVMVLEFLEGGELFDRIVQKGHYSERDASQLTKVIVSALAAMHKEGLLHRDLKPENCIYVTRKEDSLLKITDFGLAIFTNTPDKSVTDRHLVGTPGYIAPEVLNQYRYTPASDVWAAGVILFILLSGSPPFYGRTHRDIFERIKAARWSFNGKAWASVSDEAKDLVTKMLIQDPFSRLTAEGVLDHPWIRSYETLPSSPLVDTFAELKSFQARQKFRAAALACIAGNRLQRFIMSSKDPESVDAILNVFTAQELDRLKEEFAAAVRGKTALGFNDFKVIMEKLKLDHLPLERIFHVFDTDGTGDVDYREFLIGVSKFKLQGDAAIRFCFDVFDEDHSGTISRGELTKVLVHHRRRSRAQQEGFQEATAALAQVQVQVPPSSSSETEEAERLRGLTVSPVYTLNGLDEKDAEQTMPPGPPVGMEKFAPQYLQMDPDAYEIAEGIAEIFDSLDVNCDNQISLDEFLEGTKRHPELLELFFKEEEKKSQAVVAPPPGLTLEASVNMADADAGASNMDTTQSLNG